MSRKIIIQSLPTTEPNRFLDVEVYYDEGGMSYLSFVKDDGNRSKSTATGQRR